MPTEGDIRLRSANDIDALEIKYADDPETLAREVMQAKSMFEKRVALYQGIEKKHGDDIKTYTFRFRVAKGRDVEAAEKAAELPLLPRESASEETSKLPIRMRPAYFQELARRTLIGHDWPGDFPQTDADFADLDSDVRDFVLAEVGQRVYFSTDVRSFL